MHVTYDTYLDHSPAVTILGEPFLVTKWSLALRDTFRSLVNIHLHLQLQIKALYHRIIYNNLTHGMRQRSRYSFY